MKPDEKKRLKLDEVWREARDLVWARRGRLAAGLALMLVSRVAGLVLPASSKFLIDDVIGKGKHELLPLLALAAIAATLIQSSTSFALSQLLGVAAQRAITEMRKRVEQHILRLPVAYFDSTKSGILISRIMTDAEGIRNIVGTGLVQLIGSSVTAVLALCVLFYVNWAMTLITITTLVIFGLIMAFMFKRVRPLFRQRGEINAQVTGRLGESLGGIRVVKAYTTEKREDLVFAKGVHSLLRNVAQTITATSALGSFASVILGTVGVIIMLIGGRAILAGSMTLGDLVMYIFFTGMLVGPVASIASIGTQITEAFAGLDRIREVMKQQTELEEDAARQPVASIRGDVEFQEVSFEYNPGVPVLKDVSFKAPARTTTALVGSSGSGKSTLISLVMTFNRPKSGRVLIDGHDLDTLRLHDYRSHLGIVLQDNFLFDGTIAENIRYGKPDATEEELRGVARLAHVDEFVDPLEKKYDTVIGERGIKLSGGQRQRIAIARAILANPTILILDEATSSLDSESEAKIQDGLRTLRRGRTTFVIAHRLSTIRGADQILVLEEGAIVERGTHAQLLALNGRYRQLYDRQYNFETDQFVNPGEDFLPVGDEVSLKRWMLVTAVVAAAALTFVWYFGKPLVTTPGFFLDESSIAYNAWLIAQTGADEHGARMPVYFAAFGEYKNPVYIYLLAAVFKVVGPSILAARALSIVLGFLAAAVLSLLVRDPLARAFTFLAALATPWLFEISRLVFEVAAFPLAIAFALWCVQNESLLPPSGERVRVRGLLACGLAFALVTYTYTAGRFIGPMMALALLLAVPWRRALIAWTAYAVLLIPALLNLRAVTARVEEVGITGFSYFAAFSPQFLFVTGDTNARHHVPFGGMLLVTVALSALAGIAAAIRRRDPFDRYLLAVLIVAPVPGALAADEGPHALRLITVGVLLVAFAGVGMSALAAIQREQLRAALAIALFLALAAEGLAFRAQFRELGPPRLIEFDTGFPYVFARLQPPICVEESPYYIHSYWYGVLRGIDRAQLPRFQEGTEPLGQVCMGTMPVCGTCRVTRDVRWFVSYRRE